MRAIPCVGGIVLDEHGSLLLVRRGHEPARGLWSIPGGRREPGETSAAGAVREVAEETGLVVEATRLVGVVERAAADGGTYVIEDWACRVVGGTLQAGDDADDVAWFSPADLADADARGRLSPGLLEALREWGVCPG